MKRKKVKKRGKGFFKENYKLSWKYLKESKNFVYIMGSLFLFFIFVGAFLPVPPVLEQRILDFIREILERTSGMSTGELISFIFLNNIQSSFLGLVFGFFLGIFSVITIVANGYLLGFVSTKAVQVEGIFILWRLLPHGIFEIPALLISLALGLKLGMFIFYKKKLETLKNFFLESLRVFLFVIVPLLFIAAIIEASLIALAS